MFKWMKIWFIFMACCILFSTAGIAEGKEQLPEKVVYLTFDDGPKKATPELLAILDELEVPATFFLLGLQARAFPEYTRMIYERGDTIACHTMDHSSVSSKKCMRFLGMNRIRRICFGFREAAPVIRTRRKRR